MAHVQPGEAGVARMPNDSPELLRRRSATELGWVFHYSLVGEWGNKYMLKQKRFCHDIMEKLLHHMDSH